MSQRCEYQRMSDQRAGSGWEQPQAVRRLGRQRQRQIGVPAARRVIVDADTIEAGVLATGDERSKVWQRSAEWNAKSDANPGHLASFPILRPVSVTPRCPYPTLLGRDGMSAPEGKPDMAVDRLSCRHVTRRRHCRLAFDLHYKLNGMTSVRLQHQGHESN